MSGHSSDPLDAADPTRSAWVSANAGTGKTYTLANRVTRLLLNGAKPERILCLTYTKAAAAEMAGRLFEQLGKWSMLDDATLAHRIAEIGAPPCDTEGLRAARRLFALALETPGGLKIRTIHSFCQDLLARFPLEAGVPPSFRVLDDQTARELGHDARTRVLARAGGSEKVLASAVAEIAAHADETKLYGVLESALGSDRRKFERYMEQHGRDMRAVSAAIWAAHGLSAGQTHAQLAQDICAEMKMQESLLRAIADWLARGSKTDMMCSEALVRAIDSGAFEDYCAAFLTQTGGPRARLATKKLAEENPQHCLALESIAGRFVEAERKCRAARAAQLTQASLILADAVHREYTRAKRAQSALDYDDLIIETSRLLDTRSAAAWVLYKLDGGLDHILIDEGQDTSPEQWQIVQRLSEEFFAGQSAREGQPRTIFVVGDEKQSIFSFQGAAPAQFDIQRQHFASRIGHADENFVTVRLSESRRSAPEILRYVDAVFADDTARCGVTSDGAPIAHEAYRGTAKGRVEIWPTVKPLERPEPDLWQRPVDLPARDSPVVRLACDVADRIAQWTDGRTCLPGRDRPIRPGDIMVLMPRREPFASEVIRQLKQRGVPVAGADRIRLNEQIAVMDLMALGRFVLLPEDDLNLAVVLRSPLIGISEDALLALSAGRKSNLYAELAGRRNELASFEAACEFLDDGLRRADFAPPFEFYAHELGERGGRKRLLARLGVEAGDAIDEFLSLALAYEAQNTPSLEGFLHWLERGDVEVKRDMERGRNEVRVMTVHGAKGLEADIVVLPDTAAPPLAPGRRGVLLYTDDGAFFPLAAARAPDVVERAKRAVAEESLKEHRRLLYVALTRPRDRLHICGFEGKHGVRDGAWYPLMEHAARRVGIPVAREDGMQYVIGEADFEPSLQAHVHVPPVVLPPWVHAVPATEQAGPRLIRPSQAAGAEEPAVASPIAASARFARGQLIHTLLARLPALPASEWQEAARSFLAKQAVPLEDIPALIDETLRVLAHPDFAHVFTPKARAEVGIIAELPELAPGARISGRLDRLFVGRDHVLAVDFKTNRPPPATVRDVPALYLTQMALYRAALAKMFPDRPIDCALVWTFGPSLMPLPGAILDGEIGRISARLDPHGKRS
jgi:ATP-dependent helicase/nuclease subunit A